MFLLSLGAYLEQSADGAAWIATLMCVRSMRDSAVLRGFLGRTVRASAVRARDPDVLLLRLNVFFSLISSSASVCHISFRSEGSVDV